MKPFVKAGEQPCEVSVEKLEFIAIARDRFD